MTYTDVLHQLLTPAFSIYILREDGYEKMVIQSIQGKRWYSEKHKIDTYSMDDFCKDALQRFLVHGLSEVFAQ